MSGKVSVDRNYVCGIGGHGWVWYTATNGEVYVIDPAQQFIGNIKDINEGIQSFYKRPSDQ